MPAGKRASRQTTQRPPKWARDHVANAAGKWSGASGAKRLGARRSSAAAAPLPVGYGALVRLMPPQAIASDAGRDLAVEMIDRLMASGKLTRDQRLYLETLVQLVGVYESHERMTLAGTPGGVELLKHLMHEHGMIASDLARLLGVHASMGSKILNGDRSLTLDHLKRLAERFKVGPQVFMD